MIGIEVEKFSIVAVVFVTAVDFDHGAADLRRMPAWLRDQAVLADRGRLEIEAAVPLEGLPPGLVLQHQQQQW